MCADSRLVGGATLGQTQQLQFELPNGVVEQKPVQPGDARDGNAAVPAFASKVQPPKLPEWFWGPGERTVNSELSKPSESRGGRVSRLSVLRGLATTQRLGNLNKNRALRLDGILESMNYSARENQTGVVPDSAPVTATPAPAAAAEPAETKAPQQDTAVSPAKSQPTEFVPVREHELSHIFNDRVRTLPAKPGQYT